MVMSHFSESRADQDHLNAPLHSPIDPLHSGLWDLASEETPRFGVQIQTEQGSRAAGPILILFQSLTLE